MPSTKSDRNQRDVIIVEFLAKIAETSDSPVPLSTLCKEFMRERNLQLSDTFFHMRVKKIVDAILASNYTLVQKSKVLFMMSQPIPISLFDKVTKVATIRLDTEDRITFFKEINGKIQFEGTHRNKKSSKKFVRKDREEIENEENRSEENDSLEVSQADLEPNQEPPTRDVQQERSVNENIENNNTLEDVKVPRDALFHLNQQPIMNEVTKEFNIMDSNREVNSQQRNYPLFMNRQVKRELPQSPEDTTMRVMKFIKLEPESSGSPVYFQQGHGNKTADLPKFLREVDYLLYRVLKESVDNLSDQIEVLRKRIDVKELLPQRVRSHLEVCLDLIYSGDEDANKKDEVSFKKFLEELKETVENLEAGMEKVLLPMVNKKLEEVALDELIKGEEVQVSKGTIIEKFQQMISTLLKLTRGRR